MKLPSDRVKSLRAFYDGRAVCVTGGAGFVGGHLVDALLSLGARVAVIDDLSNSTLDHLMPLMEMEPGRLRFVHGSILDDDALRDAVAEARTVFHLAAVGSVPRSIEDPRRSFAVNATGTLRVLEAAKKAGAQRVILAASSSAYGDDAALPKVESQTPRPMSPYAASKVAAEGLVSAWAASYGLSGVSLRYFNIFGPRQPADSAYAAVVSSFASRLLNGESPVIFGDGMQSRDFTYVGNAVLATLLAGSSEKPLRGEVVNIGTGSRIDLTRLAALMAEKIGRPHLRPAHQPARAGDVRHSQADLSRARDLLGYEPFTSLEEGIAETLEWFKQAMVSK
jgi:UDP-glucose 4-epimerase